MCGISGFNWPDRKLIEKMNSTLRHRGPDGEGVYIDERISLGHRRLAIIDLSERANQPMCNEDGSIWLVYNGEIYNFKELRKELEQTGHRFKSDTDSEIVIHAYEKWQFSCLDRFNGMFAFAIYDSSQKVLFLARDRFGIKPLYYHTSGDKFIFSSEIKGILCHDVERTPNDRVIFDYLAFNLSQHLTETFFSGINQLPPGHYLVKNLQEQSFITKEWYRLQPEAQYTDTRDSPESIRAMITDSIHLRMVADVPVGSCLSGGLDSSSIVCLMRQLMPAGDIRTFSAVFPGQVIDESDYVKEVADFSRLDSSTVSPNEAGLLEDLDDLIRTQEEPFTGPSVYAQYRVLKLAGEKGMKVLLDGQGGDELFGGYTYYFGFYFYELFRRLKWLHLWREMYFYLSYFRNFLPARMLGFLLMPDRLKPRLWGTRVKWISDRLYASFANNGVLDPRWSAKSLNEALLVTLCHTAIPHLLIWEDKNAMRWGVETRIPFLDYRLVEMVLASPPEDKLRDGVTKYIFRQAVNGVVPEKISNRRDKIGFAVPEDTWLRSPRIIEFIRGLIESKSFRERPYWDCSKVNRTFASYLESGKQQEHSVWKWLNLELWLRQFID